MCYSFLGSLLNLNTPTFCHPDPLSNLSASFLIPPDVLNSRHWWGKSPFLHLQYSREVSLLLFFLMTLVQLRDTVFPVGFCLGIKHPGIIECLALSQRVQRFLALTSSRAPGNLIEAASHRWEVVKGHHCTHRLIFLQWCLWGSYGLRMT